MGNTLKEFSDSLNNVYDNPIRLREIKVKQQKKKGEDLAEAVHPDIERGIGQAALKSIAPGDFDMVGDKLVRVPTGGAANSSIGNIVSQVGKMNLQEAVKKPGGLDQVAAEVPAKQFTGKPKGSSLMDFGRGLVEGVLGMPESEAGSSSRIPYALGQLPGTLVRSKVGLPTSGEAMQSAMRQATMPQYRQQEIGQAKVKQEIEAAQFPGYEESLNNAVKALQKTKDPEKIKLIYQKISAAYPSKSTELKRIILLNEKETISDILAAARGL